MQKARLFKGTIKSDLLVANKIQEVTNTIWESLKCAQAKEFVEKRMENKTFVERRKKFSGGQKQRLTLRELL